MKKSIVNQLAVCLFYLLAAFPITGFAQEIAIQGTITDESGEPLIGVSILVKESSSGTVTDFDGYFSLELEANNTIAISYTGMKPVELLIKEGGTYDVVLEEETELLEQVVVIGYGQKKKKDIISAISTVSSEDLAKRNNITVGSALQGAVSGIQVTQNPRPGEQAAIRLRGYNSIVLDNRPLILVDGVEVGRLFTVSPDDIESMTVLKDAAASAIYGNRAANGVILITTKKGAFNQKTVSYNAYLGWQEATRQVPQLNAEQYVLLANEARANADLPPLYNAAEVAQWEGQEGTNWQDAVLRRGLMQNHHLNFAGGNEEANYSLSLGYLNQEGIYIETDFTRYNAKLSTEFKATEKLRVGTNMNLVYSIQNTGGDFYISRAFMMPPTVPVKFDDGRWGYDDKGATNGILKNPVQMSEFITWENTQNHIFGNLYANYEIIEGLNLKTDFRIDRRIEEKNYFEPFYVLGDPAQPQFTQAAFADRADFKDRTWDWANTLTFNRLIAQDHSLGLTLGSFARHHFNRFILGKGFNFPSEFVQTLNGIQDITVLDGTYTEYKLLGFFGRAEYDFKDKYYFTGTLRRDGTSRLSPATRWGTFYSAGVAWNLANEPFLKNIKFIDDLKLRASYGQLGNAAIPNDYPYQALVTFNLNYPFNNTSTAGGAPVDLRNENLRWETTQQLDIGADISLFNELVSLKVDYYQKTTNDLIWDPPIPATAGAGSGARPFQNIGSMENKGWDFELGFQKALKDFSFALDFTVGYLENKLTDLNGFSFTTGREGTSHIFQEGLPFRTLYGYQTDGVFQNEEELNSRPHWPNAAPGDLIFVDTNEDGTISAADRVPLGNSIPNWTYGMNLYMTFKGFDVAALVQGLTGNNILLANANFGGGRGFFNFHENLVLERLNRWHGEGTSTTHPRLVFQKDDANNNDNTDFFVEDGTYLRLKNLQIGYTLPRKWMEKLNIESLRIYWGGTNLWTQTDFTGFDPEIAAEASDSFGWNYPMAKTMLLGVNVQF